MTDEGGSPLISVVIPVFNGARTLPRCFASLQASTFTDWEGILVDDGCTDASPDIARAAGFRVVATDRPHCGPAVARNVGARTARGDILLFLDADVAVQPDSLARVAEVFRSDPGLAACFGSYDEAPADEGFLSQYKNLFHHYVHQSAREEASTFWSGCGAVRRDIFLALGGFDPSYTRPTIEDIELGYRLRRAGYRIRLEKRLQVKHMKRWTVRSLIQSDVLDRGILWTRLILATRTLPNDLNVQTGSRLSVAALYLLIFCLLLGFWWWPLWLAAVALAFLIAALNWPLYRFFARKRGWWFALRAWPWHWLYLWYSGLSFLIGLGQHLLSRRQATVASLSPFFPGEGVGTTGAGGSEAVIQPSKEVL